MAAKMLHLANARLAPARATRRRPHALGLDRDDPGGRHDARVAPFSWRAA